MEYDYIEEMVKDIKEYIEEHDLSAFHDRESLEEHLNEALWACDSVTGNASGSYTFSTWRAEENIAHNWDLIQEVCDEFGMPENPFEKGAEYWDVSIRCYLLGQAISETLDRIEMFADEDEEEELIDELLNHPEIIEERW